MGRPDPSVLFSQTFVHPHLDEYVDEVLFAEPIVITACEFLEQNASSTSQAVALVGATLPPSFALEVFVQCEGETRFRRLCQPFLYSHSSSNVLEVEAVVTSHLVVRGSYRSLSLVIYGNTAEDLGQFNIGFDDSSLTNLVSSVEGTLEDLPRALHSTNLAMEESISSLKALLLPPAASDISVEVKQVLQLLLRILNLPQLGKLLPKVVLTMVSAASSYVIHDSDCLPINQKHCTQVKAKNCEELQFIVSEARKELQELLEVLQNELGNPSAELFAECNSDFDADTVTSKQLVDILSQYFHLDRISSSIGHHQLSKSKNFILGLSVSLFLCSSRESCFHFTNGGGMEQLARDFSNDLHKSTTSKLLLLGVIEQATRYSIGCEGFLGWWPREDENVPSSVSEGYSSLLKLLLQKPRHDVASIATYVLHRLRFYEVASKYECAVVSVLGGLSAVNKVTSATLTMLSSAKSQLEKLLKLLNLRGPIEDPSTVASASRSLILGQTEGCLSYKATSSLIATSNGCFANWDIDSHLLSIMKERGLLPLSAALLSSTILHCEAGHALDILVDIASTIEAIVLSLLSCRSGLIFLLQHSEVSATVIHALKGANELIKEECVPLRYASILISKGFICAPRTVGMTFEMHLRVVNAIDRLLTSTRHSEEFLWVLWELCRLSRSDCGRQALLALGFFPEAVSILIEALHSVKESEPAIKNSGDSPLNLAILHSAAEIFEVIVTDSTASSLASWIEHAVELHKALHTSSPGSNRKDAPTRLLEWIDAGVVYHKNGVIGLLRYAAVLASGGDAHLTSTSILVSDMTDVEVIGDSTGASDINVMENLGKIISEKSYDGVVLRDSSIAQLTTAFRILAFVSENSMVAATLYDEGATSVIYAVLLNCLLMLERSSNNHDHLVDEGTERNSTSDLLLERNREQSLVDLLVPSLVLLITLLRKLQEANEQYRNTKLMNALIRLHQEVSTKLAACAADLSSPYPDSALSFGAVCHLVVSALACWPVYGWGPGLFHSLLDKVQATSLLALGPKETCGLLCLLNDLFPEEGVWLWKNEIPLLSALRKLTVGTLLGPHEERLADWYMKPAHIERILAQLTPCLDKIAQIIQHYAISALVVIQDMLRVLIIRIACLKADGACVLIRPILSWLYECVSDFTHPSDTYAYKGFKFLDFLASLLEHPRAKVLLLKEGVVDVLAKVMERGFDATDSEGKQISEIRNATKPEFTLLSWCLPVFKSFSLLCSQTPQQYPEIHDLCKFEKLSAQDCSLILPHLLKFCQVLPVGQELLACLAALRGLSSCNEGRSAFVALVSQSTTGTEDFSRYPPLLCCWKNLLKSVNLRDGLADVIETVDALSSGCLQFCMDRKSLNSDAVDVLKFLFGIPDDTSGMDESPEDNLNYIQELATLFNSKTVDADYSPSADMETILYQVSLSVKSLLLLLQKPTGSVEVDDIAIGKGVPSSPDAILFPSKMHQMSDAEKADDYLGLGGFGEKFLWECPETLPDRLSQSTLSAKRKMSTLEGPNRRARGDNSQADTATQSAFSRGIGPSTAPSVPTRRDTFRQRKPNTSRPPSMHVDDYVARERNVDSVTNSNVIAVQRVGSTSGRPPSIHVDEFMARQRERQNPTTPLVGEAPLPAQGKNSRSSDVADMEKSNKSKQLKPDLDDDLQGIDIVFDGEESECDDKLPFPQPDDNLQQPASVIGEQSSPHSIVEETGSDAPVRPNADETAQSEFSSRMSVSRPEMPLTREPSVSSDKKYFEQSEEKNKNSGAFESAASSGYRAPVYKNVSGSSVRLPADSRMHSQNLYQNSPQHSGTVPQGPYDRKFMHNQPPLPPMPPPSTAQPVSSQTPDRVQHPIPTAFQGQSDYTSTFSNTSTSLASSHPMQDLKYTSASSPGGSARPPPPLPPTPPPFSSNPYNLNSAKPPTPQSYNQSVGSYPPPPLMPPMVFSNRPASIPINLYGSTPTLQQGENSHSMGQNLNIPQSSIQSMHHPVPQLQPLQPPQLTRPPQPPQHLRPPMQSSQQLEQGPSLQSHVQMQTHPLHMPQQAQVSPMHGFYQSQQQQQMEHAQAQALHLQGDVASQQQQDSGLSLHEYFKSPEAIQSLLSDRDKLCQLLEQHPKLMQMLQDRLGQL